MLSVSCASQEVPSSPVDYFRRVLSNPDLSSTAKVLFTIICDEGAHAGNCTVAISAAELAPILNVTPDRVGKIVDELREQKIVSTRRRGSQPLEFTILAPVEALGRYYRLSGRYAELFALAVENVDLNPSKKPNQSGNPSDGFPPDPFPTRELLYSTTTTAENSAALPDDDAVVVVQKLTQFGITSSVVPDLVRRLPQRCEAWSKALEYLPADLKNPAGWVRKAIELDYALPPRYLAMQRRAAKDRNRQTQMTEQQLLLQAEIENHKLLESLPADLLYTIKLQVDEKLSTGMLSRLGPMIKGSVRDGMILEAARIARFGDHGAVA